MSETKFFTTIDVRYGDLDPQAHVNNARYLTYIEQARVDYLHALKLFHPNPELNEVGVLVANINLNYHAPISWGDPIKAGMRTTRIGNKSITTEQNIVSLDEEIVYASGEIILVMFDFKKNTSINVPQNWRETLTKFELLSN